MLSTTEHKIFCNISRPGLCLFHQDDASPEILSYMEPRFKDEDDQNDDSGTVMMKEDDESDDC